MGTHACSLPVFFQQESEHNTGSARQRHKGDRGTYGKRTPMGIKGIWAQAKGIKGGMNGRRQCRQTQECGAERRVKRRRLVGGGCGRRPCGRFFAPGEEVGSGCNRER